MKFSIKLLGKRARRHINIKSVTLNVQSVRQPWSLNTHVCIRLRKFWTALATGFWGKRSFQIISSLVRRSSIVDGLLCRNFVYESGNCNADYLRCQFNSETCRRHYVTDAMVLSFNGMALQLTAHATRAWLHATGMTLLQSMNGHQTRQILICLIIMCGVPWWKPITSWTSKPPTTEELQTRLKKCHWL